MATCRSSERLTPPQSLAAPYGESRIWAVAPFLNESGVSRLDSIRIADLFTAEAEQTHGIQTVPVNRVIAGMQVLGIDSIQSEAEAAALLTALEVDGFVVGTISAYDPYAPLQLGLAVQLFSRNQPGSPSLRDGDRGGRSLREGKHDSENGGTGFDPREAVRSPVAKGAAPRAASIVSAQASGFFDASNHTTRGQLKEYLTGRVMPDSAFGTHIYDVSMELYTRFVCYRLIGELLDAERNRLVAATAEAN